MFQGLTDDMESNVGEVLDVWRHLLRMDHSDEGSLLTEPNIIALNSEALVFRLSIDTRAKRNE